MMSSAAFVRRSLTTSLFFAILTLAVHCLGDAIDIVWFVTRATGWSQNPWRAALQVIGIMFVNFLLNVLVVGWPAIGWGVPTRNVLSDLVAVTVLAQLADRVGSIGGLLLGVGLNAALGMQGESLIGLLALLGIGGNFAISGSLIVAIVRFYAKSRWRLEPTQQRTIASRAAVFTNPAWAIALGLLL